MSGESQPSPPPPGVTPPPRIEVTRLPIDPVDLDGLLAYVVAAARDESARRTVGYLNVHVANTAATDEGVKRYLRERCDLVYCDGRGVGWGARLQGLPEPPRMTAADWLPRLLGALRDASLRTFVVAGREGVVDQALSRIANDPEIGAGPLGEIEAHHGYLGTEPTGPLTDAVLRRIEAYGPQVVLVGMGTPTQERWTLANRDRIAAPVVWPLGATFDYFAGEQARGPEWLRNAGHEWAARLVADPARLWRRYVLGNPQFLWRAWRGR
ncbi:MAG: WecB/TagA/CpsF family glycosyltransferase [Planctomycetota bacterium]